MIVDADERLDFILDAMGDFAREHGVTFVGALARTDPSGIVVRCKGIPLGNSYEHARMMMECLDGLTELKAGADPARRMPDDPELVH